VWGGRAWPPDGPVGGLKGLEATDGEPEAEDVDCARGPVGMPELGPAEGRVGEAVWLLPEMEWRAGPADQLPRPPPRPVKVGPRDGGT
jgi:hypothetical protein